MHKWQFKVEDKNATSLVEKIATSIQNMAQLKLSAVRVRRLESFNIHNDGFGGLVVSMLASGTWVRGFKPGRSRWIFRTSEKSSACLPSEGKWKNLSHVPALRHVKEPSTSVNYESASKTPCIVPSFASRRLSCLCGAWRLWGELGELIGARVQSAYRLQCRKGPIRDL